jgi:hypothetical protein
MSEIGSKGRKLMRKSLLGVLAVGLVGALGVTGCATKTYVL